MADDDYKKYTESTRRGIKGEAFFESLVVDHAIPHCIARQNDLGIDFLYKTNPDAVYYFGELVARHRKKIKATCEWMTDLLNRLPPQ
jgi:hypothetical protein